MPGRRVESKKEGQIRAGVRRDSSAQVGPSTVSYIVS